MTSSCVWVRKQPQQAQQRPPTASNGRRRPGAGERVTPFTDSFGRIDIGRATSSRALPALDSEICDSANPGLSRFGSDVISWLRRECLLAMGADRLQSLSPSESTLLGMTAGVGTKLINYPLLSWKCATQQVVPPPPNRPEKNRT